MNNTELCFGQRIDPKNNLCELWLTHGALDWVKQQDWSNKVVWMFGAGLGDAWLAKRCKWLHVVERDEAWFLNAKNLSKKYNQVQNITYHFRPCNDCSGDDKMYCEITEDVNVVINDDAYRYEVCVKAEDYFKRKNIHGHGGGVLITDNWQQSYVFMCPAAEKLLSKYESLIFEQADHLDNDGVNKWKTAIHFIE